MRTGLNYFPSYPNQYYQQMMPTPQMHSNQYPPQNPSEVPSIIHKTEFRNRTTSEGRT